MTISLPSAPSFAVAAQRVRDQTRLRVSGDIDMDTAPQLEDAVVAELRDHAPDRLVLDLSGVRFLDSSGVRALVFALNHAAAHDCGFGLADLPYGVRRVLEITGVLSVIDPHGPAAPVGG